MITCVEYASVVYMYLGFSALARPLMYSTVAFVYDVEFGTHQNQNGCTCEPTAVGQGKEFSNCSKELVGWEDINKAWGPRKAAYSISLICAMAACALSNNCRPENP